MGDDESAALDRIDAALRRIEAVSHRPLGSNDSAALAHKYATLRGTVENAVASLDQLIEKGAPHG
jgi:hypothetical protein